MELPPRDVVLVDENNEETDINGRPLPPGYYTRTEVDDSSLPPGTFNYRGPDINGMPNIKLVNSPEPLPPVFTSK
jgi:hypothetical protein